MFIFFRLQTSKYVIYRPPQILTSKLGPHTERIDLKLVTSSKNVFILLQTKMKWNESGFSPPLCTYRLNWARRTSWGWWDDLDDTVLQTQDSKFEPWRFEAEHATSQSRRLPTILPFTRGWGRNIFCFFQTAVTGKRTPNSGVKGSGANHYPRAPALCSRPTDLWVPSSQWDKAWSELGSALTQHIIRTRLLYII